MFYCARQIAGVYCDIIQQPPTVSSVCPTTDKSRHMIHKARAVSLSDMVVKIFLTEKHLTRWVDRGGGHLTFDVLFIGSIVKACCTVRTVVQTATQGEIKGSS
jgi:hypothetical protein